MRWISHLQTYKSLFYFPNLAYGGYASQIRGVSTKCLEVRDENSCLIIFIHPIIILHSSWLLMSRLRGVLAWDHLSQHMAAWCLCLCLITQIQLGGVCMWQVGTKCIDGRAGMDHPRLVVPEKMCRITHGCRLRFAHPLMTESGFSGFSVLIMPVSLCWAGPKAQFIK